MDLDSNGNLYTESGKSVQELKLNPQAYVDKTVVIYGPTKTGKTVITKNIMKIVNNYIDQVLIIAPSEPSNRSYEGFVDAPFIHYKMYHKGDNERKFNWKDKALDFLESIWKRQEMMAAIYTRTNNVVVLKSLFSRTSRHVREEVSPILKTIESKQREAICKIENSFSDGVKDEKINNMNEKFNNMTIQIYKKYIHIEYENLWKQELTEDERYSLQYLLFNPRLLLIFDDCAAQLKPFFSTEIFRKLFYQNRHSYITLIICCQDDTDIPTNLRKNAFISFYTEPVVCLSNFERQSNKYSRQMKALANEVIEITFKGFRKIAYIREDDQRNFFYHITFEYPKKFKFGSKAIHDLCNIVENKEISMDKENPYYDCFKI